MKIIRRQLRSSRQLGVGLIEILVALLVLAIGVLGYAGLQLGALKGTEMAHARALGTGVAQDLLERMLVNPEGDYAQASSWSATYPALDEPVGWKNCISQACSIAQMVTWDINSVRWHAVRTLPAGRVSVMPCGFSAATCVIVSWDDQVPSECISASGIKNDLDAACVVLEATR